VDPRSRKNERMASPCLPGTASSECSPTLAPGSLTPSHPGSSLELRPLSCNLLETVRQDVEAHPALNRSAVLLQLAVAVPVPPGFLLREEVPVHVDDAYLAHVRLLRVAHARETPEQIKKKLQSSY
jgi:hypothetical protein